MPFKHEAKPYAYAVVSALARNQTGVYGLFKDQRWIYVGKGDIRERLMDHLGGDNPCITREAPAQFVAEVIKSAPEMERREKELILELDPVCNQRVG